MWLKKIKKNKVQYGLVGFMVFLSVCIFTLCWCFVSEFSTFATTVLTEDNSSDVYIVSFGCNELEDNIIEDEEKENIESYNAFVGASISEPILYNEKDVTLLYQMMLDVEDVNDMEEFTIIESENDKIAPEKGEVWLPQVLAMPNGINIGDEIEISYDNPVKLRVSGIYTAKLLTSSNLAFAPIMVCDKDFNEIKENNEEYDAAIFAINLVENSDEKASDLADSFPYCAFFATRTALQENFISVAGMLGSVGSLAAIVIFFVSMAMMRYVIKSMIMRDLKNIAVWKSLGYRNRQIKKIYKRGIMVIGTIAATIGAIIPIGFIDDLGRACSQFAAGFEVTVVTYSMAIMSVVLFLVILSININIALGKIKKLTPVEIINLGQAKGSKKLPRPLIKDAKSPLAMAVNDIYKHKGVNFLIMVVFVLATYIAMMFSMVGYSAYTMIDNSNLWFGIPNCNTYAMGSMDDEVLDWIENDDRVEHVVYGSICYSTLVESDTIETGLSNIKFDILSDRSQNTTGIRIEGEAATKNDEVIVTDEVLELFGLNIGDTLEISINGKDKKFTIKGRYDTMFSNYGIMVSPETMKECVSDFTIYNAFITLKDLDKQDTFCSELEDEFDGITVGDEWFAVKNAMVATRQMLLGISVILIITVLIFVVLNLSMVLFIEGIDRRKEYGIMKALGFTNTFIAMKSVSKNLIIASISIVIALIIHLSTTREKLGEQIIDAFVDSPLLLCLVVVGFFGITYLVTRLITLGIKKISPTELMEE